MMHKLKKEKVFVGMSGGVDSSVSALLLKRQGYEVIGVFIKVWQPDFVECTWREDRRDAMRVCSELEIPFITLDLEREYKEGVIDYMLREYQAGRTPNPDVFCNKEVKFGAFLDWALKNGGYYIATGHYARIRARQLERGRDRSKDQSYFLWTLTSRQLQHVIFPVGDLLKTEIRNIASLAKLATAKKKDSQGLCFLGKIEVKDFLNNYIENKTGKIIDYDSGEMIGEHEGTFFYTLGEKVKGKYVLAKDLAKNILYVAENPNKKENSQEEIILENINFSQDLEVGTEYSVEERYHTKEVKIKILKLEFRDKAGELSIEYNLLDKERSIIKTSGQSLVFYLGDILIGGGIIK